MTVRPNNIIATKNDSMTFSPFFARPSNSLTLSLSVRQSNRSFTVTSRWTFLCHSHSQVTLTHRHLHSTPIFITIYLQKKKRQPSLPLQHWQPRYRHSFYSTESTIMMHNNSMKKNFVAVALLVLAATVTAQLDTLPVLVEEFPLSTTSATNCDTIVENSNFEGTCCALNVTAGNGCVLNVAGGRCKVRSTRFQYFLLFFYLCPRHWLGYLAKSLASNR